MKKIFFCLLSNILITQVALSQIELAGVCSDKAGNLFCAGSFTNTIDCGNNAILKPSGESDIFIAKYGMNGACAWACRFGGLNPEVASGICVDSYGNTYVTGSFSVSTNFKKIQLSASSKKVYQSPNFYIVKLNASGDPVWAKSSKNEGRDDGYAITNDLIGNIYIAGTFDNTFDCDGKTVSAQGKTDLFVLKMTSTGTILWLKNYGDKGENSCGSIFVSGDKLYVSTSEELVGGYKAQLLCLSSNNGEIGWTKDLGTKMGSIDAITVDSDRSVLITGYIESSSNGEGQEMLIAKYSSEGNDIWMKRFSGGFPIGKAITTDQNKNIFITGSYSDSLRMGKLYVGAYPKEDIFLAKLGPNGNTQSLFYAGNSKLDRGNSLMFSSNKLILGGTFSDGLQFDKMKVKGASNTVFFASFETLKYTCSDLKVLISETDNTDEVTFTDIYGKLLTGGSQSKTFLSDQSLHLEDEKGTVLKRTVTDENGDFSFKNIDANLSMNLVIEKSEKLNGVNDIYLATQTGLIVDKMSVNDQKFKYHIIQAELVKFQEIPEENVELKFTEFGGNGGKEFMVTERISYEPNSWSIPPEAIPQLIKLSQYLKRYSRARLEINSHTDALGDAEFNKKLSVIRGEEVRDFLVKKGVSINKVTVIGHGEENIINRCLNDINCSESEHAYNRRIEFRVYLGSGF